MSICNKRFIFCGHHFSKQWFEIIFEYLCFCVFEIKKIFWWCAVSSREWTELSNYNLIQATVVLLPVFSWNFNKMENNLKVSVVVVGDSKIGKTALIRQFTNKTFTEVRTKFVSLDVFIDDFLQDQYSLFCTKTGC